MCSFSQVSFRKRRSSLSVTIISSSGTNRCVCESKVSAGTQLMIFGILFALFFFWCFYFSLGSIAHILALSAAAFLTCECTCAHTLANPPRLSKGSSAVDESALISTSGACCPPFTQLAPSTSWVWNRCRFSVLLGQCTSTRELHTGDPRLPVSLAAESNATCPMTFIPDVLETPPRLWTSSTVSQRFDPQHKYLAKGTNLPAKLFVIS